MTKIVILYFLQHWLKAIKVREKKKIYHHSTKYRLHIITIDKGGDNQFCWNTNVFLSICQRYLLRYPSECQIGKTRCDNIHIHSFKVIFISQFGSRSSVYCLSGRRDLLKSSNIKHLLHEFCTPIPREKIQIFFLAQNKRYFT